MKITLGGSTALGFLAIAFIVLKLCEVIDWSWWWVLSPLWAPFVLCALIVIIIIIYVGLRGY